jgi:hypothetical protein
VRPYERINGYAVIQEPDRLGGQVERLDFIASAYATVKHLSSTQQPGQVDNDRPSVSFTVTNSPSIRAGAWQAVEFRGQRFRVFRKMFSSTHVTLVAHEN